MGNEHDIAVDDDRALEGELRQRFAVRAERFVHGAVELDLVLPADPEALIDEKAFAADERLPYWAELWPSARALARHLIEAPPTTGVVVELGCGLGLPSLALRRLGRDPLATDLDHDALRFARANAARNGIGPLRTACADWRLASAAVPPADLLLAADVAYEKRHAEALGALVPTLLRPGGALLLADPGRRWIEALLEPLRAAGLAVEEVAIRTETQGGAAGPVPIGVRIVRASRHPQATPSLTARRSGSPAPVEGPARG